MPVDAGASRDGVVYQREQYAKGGLSRKYWDLRDENIIRAAGDRGRLLDAGCGEGLLLEKFIKRFPGREIRGVDVDPINIRICREHGLPVVEGGLYGLPFEDKSFDAALFIEVVEHLDHPIKAIVELNRVLVPGGRLLVMFPNDLTMKVARLMMLMFKEAFYDPGHLRQWTPGDMRAALEQSGFRVVGNKSMPLPFFALSLHHLVVAEKV